MHGTGWLAASLAVYVLMNHWTNQLALAHPHMRDIVYLYSPFAWVLVHAVLLAAYAACVYSRPDLDLLCRRLALGYLLKAITQHVTVVPQPMILGGAEPCRGVAWWQVLGCADMMFSGHTLTTMLVLYKYEWRMAAVFVMAFQLVFAKWHYMSDCLVAVFAATAVETWVPR